LAFSVAVHLTPEILLLDEVLAVGDAEFREKSFNKMKELLSSGATIIFVSHNESAVKEICRRAIWLDSGVVRMDGRSIEVVEKYLGFATQPPSSVSATQPPSSVSATQPPSSVSATQPPLNETPEIPQLIPQKNWNQPESAPGNTIVSLFQVSVKNQESEISANLRSGESASIQFIYWNKVDDTRLSTTIVLFNEDGAIVFSSISNHEPNWHGIPRKIGLYQSTCQIPADLLSPGIYSVTVLIFANNYETCFREDNMVRFQVVDSGEVRGDYSGGYSGIIRPLLKWDTSLFELSETRTDFEK